MRFDYQKLLNDRQYQAVVNYQGPVLILAGAGSGKTRVITFRISYLLDKGVPQNQILSVTFTNKAAREMGERIKELTQRRLTNLTVSTFHALGVKILREHIQRLGFRPNFSIYDSQDKQDLIKETAVELGISRDSLDLYALDSLFSGIKTKRLQWNPYNEMWKDLYLEYQDHLKVYNAVDFDDLITLPIDLFTKCPDVLEEYRQRFKYFMVDEFQDTSRIQYDLIYLLAKESQNLCVVGDDDQSIYSWRGANYENILQFERDFPSFKEIKLEQNYRSTGKILLAANAVIANNENRKEKQLWTGSEQGKSLQYHLVENERREGELIAEMIQSLRIKYNMSYENFGVLVRTNSLTRSIEEAFLKSNMPYRVSGGMSFFQRKEVKDIIAYLRVITNPDDDVNLLRIVNTPKRGIGKKTLEILMELANEKDYSLYSSMSAMRSATDSPLADKIKALLNEFMGTIEYYSARFKSGKKMADTLRSLVEHINYWDYLVSEHKKGNVARWKYLNIDALVNSLSEYESDPDIIEPSIYGYLNRISLMSRDDNDNDEDEKKINLMTIHSAKGLEYDVVFLAGTEEGIIPHQRSVEENESNIEEERRLFYVAITRARKILYLTACRERRRKGTPVEVNPSPFLMEIPEELLEFNEEEEFVQNETAENYFEKIKAGFKTTEDQ
ncbi:MAG: UvrD-helicase domain-containing protein [Spirochaetales bacterium]|nr:UvrD-helicase domain-containing protein [Spirochaetales bacterium]